MERGRVAPTKASLKLLQCAVNQFQMDMGRLPTASEGLNALIHQPANVQSWPPGGYMETADVPTDSWGNKFAYVLDSNLPGGFGIYSCGPDGVTSSRGNDGDDLRTWDASSSWDGSGGAQTGKDALFPRIASWAILPLLLTAILVILRRGFARDRESS